MRVREIAEILGSTFEGNGEQEILAAAPLDNARGTEISFVGGRKAVDKAQHSAAGCLIVAPEFANPSGRTLIRASNPRGAFAAVLARLYARPAPTPGIHASAVIADSADIHPSCSIGPHVVIREGARVGAHTEIEAGSVVGREVAVGERCHLYARVSLYEGVQIGDRVVLHSGCVLGADGFGFVLQGGRYEKFPQVGRVIIEDDVEIGANSCVDRAALGATVIGAGTKLDNMVHIGHNCRIGRHVVIAAQTGLSGGVVVEDYAVIGGQVGIGDKARIESRAVLGSGSGVLTSKIVRTGQTVWGTPARPLKEYLQLLANLGKVSELREDVAELKRKLAAMNLAQ